MKDEIQDLIDTIDSMIHWTDELSEERKQLQALSNALTKADQAFEKLYLEELLKL